MNQDSKINCATQSPYPDEPQVKGIIRFVPGDIFNAMDGCLFTIIPYPTIGSFHFDLFKDLQEKLTNSTKTLCFKVPFW